MLSRKAALFLDARDDAIRRGDRGVERAMNAELARLGYVETPPERAEPVFETTEPPVMETAVPAKRRGRPPKARPAE